MREIRKVTGTAVPLPFDDIDTDRIIPARYLRCVTFEGLGEHAFEDDRQQDPQHPFNNPQYAGAKVLVAGRNFGCGSSREHAPQALIRWGIAAVIGESFAEIFFGNCTTLGVPCVTAARADIEKLAAAIRQDPSIEVTVDVAADTVRYGTQSFAAKLPPGPKQALTTGQWDFLSQLVEAGDEIRATAGRLPYMTNFA